MEKQSYRIGDILRNPFVGYENRRHAYFVYMGIHGQTVSIIRLDGHNFEYEQQGFYKSDILHPKSERCIFKKVGHTRAFDVLNCEIENLIDQEDHESRNPS